MNKVKTILAAALSLVLAASCNKAETTPTEEIAVNYSVNVPMTKALGEGTAVNKVWYAVYRTDGSLLKNYQPVDFKDGKANCQVVMMRGQSYKVLFVAQHYEGADAAYEITPATATLTMPTSAVANSDNYDIFTFVDDVVNYDGTPTDAVVLERRVAQVNFICNDTDWANAGALGLLPTHSAVTLTSVPQTYNLLSGIPSTATASVTYAKNARPAGDMNLAAVFCFVGASDASTDFTTDATLSLYTSEDQVEAVRTITVDNLPVKSNYKTNVNGNIMTGSVNYSITIDPVGDETNHPF